MVVVVVVPAELESSGRRVAEPRCQQRQRARRRPVHRQSNATRRQLERPGIVGQRCGGDDG